MKCQEFELRVTELVKRAGVDQPDSELIRHGEECGACSRRLEEERALEEGQLARLAGNYRQLSPSPDLRVRLMRTYQTEIQAIRQLRSQEERSDRAPYWLLAAAAIVLAVAVGWLYWITSSRPTGELLSTLAGLDSRAGISTLARTPPGTSDSIPQMYSEFIPIGNCRSLDCLDRARMMRIDLPRSSVSYFGIPRTRIRSGGDRIAADVLVGEDGIARAIRFVF